ncbi:MAG: PA2779 family protein [Nitrospirota bacterium]|nr:PA2779 family protein [Nitrospirota bacterium]
MRIPLMKQISWYLIAAILIIAVVPRADAAFSPSGIIPLENMDRETDLAKIQKVIENKIIRERLEALGFSQENIQQRLSGLSDQQAHQLVQELDNLRVGSGDGFGVIIALLVIAILVVLLLQLTGHKVIVT